MLLETNNLGPAQRNTQSESHSARWFFLQKVCVRTQARPAITPDQNGFHLLPLMLVVTVSHPIGGMLASKSE